MTVSGALRIDIWSDVVCPWCAIGFAQLQKALGQLGGEVEAQIRWRPFELNPDMGPQGEEQGAHLRRKYRRSEEETLAARAQIMAMAENAGISLRYEGDEADAPPAMMWNTRDCHKLLSFAWQEAGSTVQTSLKLALFRAHFNHRSKLSDRSVLLDIAAEAGIHRETARAALEDEELERRVIAEERLAWDLNIAGVPAMVINDRYLIPGAQTSDSYVAALRRLAQKESIKGG